jgi:hypothetical protein
MRHAAALPNMRQTTDSQSEDPEAQSRTLPCRCVEHHREWPRSPDKTRREGFSKCNPGIQRDPRCIVGVLGNEFDESIALVGLCHSVFGRWMFTIRPAWRNSSHIQGSVTHSSRLPIYIVESLFVPCMLLVKEVRIIGLGPRTNVAPLTCQDGK